MREDRNVSLADLTTLRLGGQAARLITVDDVDDFADVARDIGRDGMLILGGGSNIVVSDDGVDVPVIRVGTNGIEVTRVGDDVEVSVAAGESWDDFVGLATAEGWSGIETLAGIPGLVGATPIQNVGAYGQEVSDAITDVDVYDRRTSRRSRMRPTDCQFGYRTSVFKSEPNRFVILTVQFRLRRFELSEPVAYAELARVLGVDVAARVPLERAQEAVMSLRRQKGMVLDPEDHDTWSVGSFFTNPFLDDQSLLPQQAPRWEQSDGRVKTSAAWLIEQAGFAKGFGSDIGRGRVTLSHKHTLALTNRGDATTAELLTLARLVRDGVQEKLGITLHPEPTLIGVHL
jgi:UDP-N-acetylmuramate dehydrogenase